MILVTGGTGSFGYAFVARHHGKGIRVLSRDEEKQRAMAERFPDVEYVIGDIRDQDIVRRSMYDVDAVFHAAALKQVPPLERQPIEAVKTNVLGTENVCLEAWDAGARVVTISTDKAVEPVGVMGASKFLAEAITASYGFNSVRYGNVIGSRGSIIPVWRAAMARGDPIRITDPAMTRFLITLDEALDLIDLAMEAQPDGSVYVRRSPAATVRQLADVIGDGHPAVVTGIRPGEKRHEHLVVDDEHVIDADGYFIVKPRLPGSGIRYSSETAPRLTDEQLGQLVAVA